MSDELHAKLLGFLAAEFARKEGRQCTRIDLEYAQPGGFRPEPMQSWTRQDQPELFDNFVQVEQLTSTIIELAEGRADTFGMGSHRFVIRTHQHLGGRATHAFKISPSYESSSDQAMTVPGQQSSDVIGNAMGVVTQNNLALMRSNQAMFTAAFGPLAAITKDLQAENSVLSAEVRRLTKELDEAKSNKDEREFSIAMRMQREARTTKGLDKILQIGTVVAAKMTGGDKDPGAPTPLSMLLTELGQSLRQEQIPALFNVLDMGQRILFAEIMKMVMPPEKPADAPANGANGTAHP